MTGPEGNSEFCFPRISMFPEAKPVTAVAGQHSLGNSTLLPSDAIDFAMLPSQRFWWETVSLLGVM